MSTKIHSLSIFFIAFFPFLCMTSSKTPQTYFPKSDLEISKIKKRTGASLLFFISSAALELHRHRHRHRTHWTQQGARKKQNSVTPVVGGWVRDQKKDQGQIYFFDIFYRVF
jgi:hypothetical protein